MPPVFVGSEGTPSREIPFAVVYSDSDDPGAGQQTLVANAPLAIEHDVPMQTASLFLWPDYRRYAPMRESVPQSSPWVPLPEGSSVKAACWPPP